MGRSFNTMADRIGTMLTGQKELMAGVSHELRSPLARMKVALELLREDGAPGDRIDEVEEEVDAIDAMIAELLTVSRLDLGSTQLNLQSCDVEELGRKAWRRVEDEAESAGMQLDIQLEDNAQMVEVDEALLIRVLGNLFENALRYAGAGTVALRSRRTDSEAQSEVTCR
jgi:two-component system sensor histidine kinase CpxA